MAKKRYLLLGGMGYAGARTALFLAQNAEVTVTSRSFSPVRKKWLELNPTIQWAQYDSANTALPAGTFDAIINFAMPSSWEAVKAPDEARKGALATVLAILEKFNKGACGSLVHLSSFHLYGPQNTNHYLETLVPNPQHPYGKIHLACEQLLQEKAGSLPITILRPTNSVGRPGIAELGVQEQLIFHDCCKQAVERGQIALRNDGESFRDFFPMQDLCSAIELALERSPSPVNTFNLASGKAITLKSFVALIQEQAQKTLDREVHLIFGKDVDNYRTPFSVDCSRMNELGWDRSGSLKEEIAGILSFQREQMK